MKEINKTFNEITNFKEYVDLNGSPIGFNRKFIMHYRMKDGIEILPRGGITICAVLRYDTVSGCYLKIAAAVCSGLDNFWKKVGRDIAIRRATRGDWPTWESKGLCSSPTFASNELRKVIESGDDKWLWRQYIKPYMNILRDSVMRQYASRLSLAYKDQKSRDRFIEILFGSEGFITCRTCPKRTTCGGAWDSYNINGECIMEK